MPITLDGTNGITTPTYGGADTSEYLVPVTAFKNRIINGNMSIDQRNAGASLTLNGSAGQYGIDRYAYNTSQASKLTAQQSTTVPVGFYNSNLITVSSAATIGSGDYFTMFQHIEANNVSDLNFGSANAKTVTLSFWVRSSVTGTFVVGLLNSSFNRTYLATYTVTAANTWEQKTITIAGDTTGTWSAGGNGTGITVRFDLGSGSGGMGTANAWQAGNLWSVSGSASSTFAAQSGATFYITGVQLEVGSTATSFDYRPYGTELALCQRYFEKSYNSALAVGTASDSGICSSFGIYNVRTTLTIESGFQFKITKRATPSVVIYDSAGNINKCTRVDVAILGSNNQDMYIVDIGENALRVGSGGTANAGRIAFHFTASAEL